MAGCATTPGPAEPGGTCSAAPGQAFVGQTVSEEIGRKILAATGARVLRWAAPDMMMTMEFSAERVTVHYGTDNRSYVDVGAMSPPQGFARRVNYDASGRSVADTNHFAVHGGVPTLICGPQGGNTCEANEYVEVDSLLPTARAIAASAVELLGAR